MKAILDTGQGVALIDRSESKHDAVGKWLRDYEGTLYSTEAVLTEVREAGADMRCYVNRRGCFEDSSPVCRVYHTFLIKKWKDALRRLR